MIKYPPVPKEIEGLAGPIQIFRPRRIPYPGSHEILGLWDSTRRAVLIKSSLRPRVAWQVLLHELAHAAMWDSGTTAHFTAKVEESVADSTASSMMRVVHHLLTVSNPNKPKRR